MLDDYVDRNTLEEISMKAIYFDTDNLDPVSYTHLPALPASSTPGKLTEFLMVPSSR